MAEARHNLPDREFPTEIRSNGDDAQSGVIPDRSRFTTEATVQYIWKGLGLPQDALKSLYLEGKGLGLPSSFKIGHLAQSSIALSALAAALIHSIRNESPLPQVSVSLKHAAAEFNVEKFSLLDNKPPPSPWGDIGGLHKTSDGYVRIHDNFPHHRSGALSILGCSPNASRSDVVKAVSNWAAIDLETVAFRENCVIAALRSFQQWDVLPQAKAISNFPIIIRKIAPGPVGLPSHLTPNNDRCLRGLKVVELSRVIAAPVAGQTLALHGAKVLWITSPNLPGIASLDPLLSRGKRSAHLNLHTEADRTTLRNLAKDADVFIQGYRPGSLAEKGFSPQDLAALHPGIIYANLSAYGPEGPWSSNRGFDSLVQTCSGLNVSEASHFDGSGSTAAKPLPCQALDHAAGYFLATGIMAALYKRAVEGGSYEVHVSLAATMKYLRSLGQFTGSGGFQCPGLTEMDDVKEFLFTGPSGFGELTSLKHAAAVEGAMPGFDFLSNPRGSDKPEWGGKVE